MNCTADPPARLPWSRAVLTALITLCALVLAAGTASAATAPAPENRIRASSIAAQTLDRPPQDVSADQRLGNEPPRAEVVVATGVAAKTADDWPVLSGIVRDAARGKGNHGLGFGTASQATRAGESWVGEGYRIASDGKTLVSRDGLRTFRPPTWKPNQGKSQANFEYWIGVREGRPFGNGHLDITDTVP